MPNDYEEGPEWRCYRHYGRQRSGSTDRHVIAPRPSIARSCRGTRGLLLLLWLLCAALWVTPAMAATFNWTGQDSANWSDPDNWDQYPHVPQNGDDLYFGYISDSNRNMTNDIPNLAPFSLNFANNDYQLSGNSLSLSFLNNMDNAAVSFGVPSETVDINCPLVFGFGQVSTGASAGFVTQTTLYTHLNGPITVLGGLMLWASSSNENPGGGNGKLYVSGVISGNGDVMALADDDGSGDVSSVEFDGTAGNTFTGTLWVSSSGSGQIVFNKASGFVATNCVAVAAVGSRTNANINLGAVNQLGDGTALEVTNGLALHLSGNNVTVGSLVLTNSAGDTNSSTLDTGSIEVGLNYSLTSWNDSISVTPVIKGKINLNGVVNCTMGGTTYRGLEMQAKLASLGGLSVNGSSALLLEASNAFTGPVIINSGTLDLRAQGALGLGSGVQLNGGALTLNSMDIAGKLLSVTAPNSTLDANGPCTWEGSITLDDQLSVYAADSLQLAINGNISGAGGFLFLGQNIGLGGIPNTYTGTTHSLCALLQLNGGFGGWAGSNQIMSGPLVIGNSSGASCEVRWENYARLFNFSSADLPTVTLFPGALMNLNGFQDIIGSLTFNGGTVELGTNGVLMPGPVLVNPNTNNERVFIEGGQLDTGPYLGPVSFPASSLSTIDVESSLYNALIISSSIGGDSGITKSGPGDLALTGNNTFTGQNLISNGVVDVYSPTALGNVFNATTVGPAGTLQLETSVTIEPMLTNNGAVLLQPGITLNLDGGLTNSGVVLVTPGANLILGSGGTSGSTSGSIIVGAGNLLVEGPANFAGTVNVAGSNIFNLSDFYVANMTGDYTCTNNALIIESGTANFDGTGIIAPATLTLSGGSLGGSNLVAVGSAMNWTGGTLNGTGRTFIAPGAALNITNTSPLFLTSYTLENGGSATWSGTSLISMNGGVITNDAGASFNIQSPVSLSWGGGSPRFDNAGVVRAAPGAGTINVTAAFNNYNDTQIQSGTLQLGGGGLNTGTIEVAAGTTLSLIGVFNASPASSITGAGNFTVSGANATLAGLLNVVGTNTFSGGTVELNGNYICTNTLVVSGGSPNFDGTGPVSPAVLNLSGGNLGGSNAVTVLKVMNWTGGSLVGAGRTVIAPAATLNIASASSLFASSRTLENAGNAIWTGAGSLSLNGNIFTNRPGALFNIQNAASISFGGGAPRFDNAGTLRKSVSVGTTTFATVGFTNYGLVDLQSGVLFMNGGGYSSLSNSVLRCALAGKTPGTNFGQLRVSGAVNLNGALNVALANGYLPATNDTFTLLTAGTRNGAFSGFSYPSNQVTMVLNNTATSVVVQVTGVAPLAPPAPLLLLPQISGSNITLTWTAISNITYRLEFNPDLTHSNWNAVPGDVTSTGSVASKLDSLTSSNRFYRIRLIP